jgi:hypothetical protein
MPARLVPSLEQVRRTVEAEAAHTPSRLEVLARLPHNPVGIGFASGARVLHVFLKIAHPWRTLEADQYFDRHCKRNYRR